jgi:hypothetical protein
MLSKFSITYGRRTAVSFAAITAMAFGVSACGSSSTSSSSAVAGNPVSSRSFYQQRLNLAKCLRAHGVNVPDPSANGGPGAGFGAAGGFRTLRDNPNFRTALQACAKFRVGGFGNLTPAQREQFRQDAVKFAECMRSHGVDLPDPGSNGAGGFGIFRSISPSERQSPTFQAAIKACSSNLPFRRGGPPGGAPPASA